jgi:hypothetical protein
VKLNNLIFSAIYNFTPSSLQLAMVQGLIIKHKAITLIIFWACPSIKMEGRTLHSYLFIFTDVSVANKKDIRFNCSRKHHQKRHTNNHLQQSP